MKILSLVSLGLMLSLLGCGGKKGGGSDTPVGGVFTSALSTQDGIYSESNNMGTLIFGARTYQVSVQHQAIMRAKQEAHYNRVQPIEYGQYGNLKYRARVTAMDPSYVVNPQYPGQYPGQYPQYPGQYPQYPQNPYAPGYVPGNTYGGAGTLQIQNVNFY